jgi:hypothetical protein
MKGNLFFLTLFNLNNNKMDLKIVIKDIKLNYILNILIIL